MDDSGELKCSFCGKKQKEVKKLVAGPCMYICDVCAELCREIMWSNGARPDGRVMLRVKGGNIVVIDEANETSFSFSVETSDADAWSRFCQRAIAVSHAVNSELVAERKPEET